MPKILVALAQGLGAAPDDADRLLLRFVNVASHQRALKRMPVLPLLIRQQFDRQGGLHDVTVVCPSHGATTLRRFFSVVTDFEFAFKTINNMRLMVPPYDTE